MNPSSSTADSSAQQPPPAIRCRGLGRSIGGKTILESIDLEVAPGEFVIVSGPSGAGKTSLLRLIAGLDRPSAGSVEIDGRTASTADSILPPFQRRVGMVFEHAALWPHLSVEQHLSIVLKAAGVSLDERRGRIERLLAELRIVRLRGQFPHELSGGERQRVALGRSLAPGPRILLLDEPLAHLDVHLAGEVADLMVRLHREMDLTTLCVMHRPERLNAVADRYVILEAGRIVQAGPGAEVFASPASDFVRALANVVGNTPFV